MNAPEALQLGLHKSMPAERYHSIAAMSAGGLKRMRMSPAHFYGLQMDPERPRSGDPTPAMKAGTLFHVALFEPDALATRYVIKPEGMSFASKDGKAWRDAQPAGVDIIDADALAKAKTQARNVRADADIAALMADGFAEASAFWLDDHTGELCKCRPDWTSPAGDGVVLVDGKPLPDDPRIVDSTGALELPAVPKRMLVIGGGIAGISAAARLSELGSVTVLEGEAALGHHAEAVAGAIHGLAERLRAKPSSPSTSAIVCALLCCSSQIFSSTVPGAMRR